MSHQKFIDRKEELEMLDYDYSRNIVHFLLYTAGEE